MLHLFRHRDPCPRAGIRTQDCPIDVVDSLVGGSDCGVRAAKVKERQTNPQPLVGPAVSEPHQAQPTKPYRQ